MVEVGSRESYMENTRHLLLIVILMLVPCLTACVSVNRHQKVQYLLKKERRRTDAYRDRMILVAQANARMEFEIDQRVTDYNRVQEDLMQLVGREQQVNALRGERDALARRVGVLRDQTVRSEAEKTFLELGAKEGVQYDSSTGRLTLKNQVLFGSGEAKVRESGRQVLREVARALKKTQGPIRIEGHTDGDPIHRSRERWRYGNWELSGTRALAVLNVLVTEGGVDESRLSFAGYGPYRPVSENSTPQGKARNRRVEIRVAPVEQGGME